jgi:outer membrane receptor protein involved in Fe transport
MGDALVSSEVAKRHNCLRSNHQITKMKCRGHMKLAKSVMVSVYGLIAAGPYASAGAADSESVSGATGATDLRPARKRTIEEIVVTAQKRGDERLQDVPIPVSVLSADSLLESGKTGLQDYFSKVPGVTLTSAVGGANTVIIRGVATNASNDNPTVGMTLDDAPYGSSTFLGGGLQPVDMDPNELTRLEVLRGPQGTLYGASSMGGLVRYVMADPSLDDLSGRLVMSTQNTENGDGWDYGLRANANIPINASLGFRVSGFSREDAGYIDDSLGSGKGINDGHAYGGRVAALWRLSDNVSIKLSTMRQVLQTDAANVVDYDSSGDAALQTSDYFIGANGTDRSVTFSAATIQASFNKIDVTSITAYSSTDSVQREALTRGGALGLLFFGAPGADAMRYSLDQATAKLSQELRIGMSLGSRVDWILGAFYTKEEADYLETISSAVRVTGESLGFGDILTGTYDPSYQEIAAFTNFTIKLTAKFDVQVGSRWSKNRQSLSSYLSGNLVGGGEFTNGPIRADDDPVTYLLAPRFKFTDDWMLYARVASGYRPGGPSFNSAVTGGPESIKADTTKNYEMGIKGNLLERMFSIDASVYYIDWKDIPVTVRSTISPLGYLINAGGAISKGVELSLELHPTDGLTFSTWGAWNDAYINELPTGSSLQVVDPIDVGDRLPFSPKFSAAASIQYDRTLASGMEGSAGISYRYIGDRPGTVGAETNVLSAYSQVDAHLGVAIDKWKVDAFINNLTDERGMIGLSPFGGNPPTAVLIIRPRTIGLSVAREF